MMLDRAITFAPSGKVVISALASLRKGADSGSNSMPIHLDQMPPFDYEQTRFGENGKIIVRQGYDSTGHTRLSEDRSRSPDSSPGHSVST